MASRDASCEAMLSPEVVKGLLRIRTVTAFVHLQRTDFTKEGLPAVSLKNKLERCSKVLGKMESRLVESGYEVQTVRIATNPFGEWLLEGDSMEMVQKRLQGIDSLLSLHNLSFCSLGPAVDKVEIQRYCVPIIEASPRLCCSALVEPNDTESAFAAAQCILSISRKDQPPFLEGGIGNFRFCAASRCRPQIPFFPAAKASSYHDPTKENDGGGLVGFALGLENGALAKALLSKTKTIRNVSTTFRDGMTFALRPLDNMGQDVASQMECSFLGVDSSLNPSLDEAGSVAAAVEELEEVSCNFGGVGTLAAASALTTALQSLPDLELCGYCGLMLPVCEDLRLAELSNTLRLSDLLSISSVCGVGIDTVPIPGTASESALASLLLDVAGLAGKWDKPLSCRVFPIPGKSAGTMTTFDSPYLCNSEIFRL